MAASARTTLSRNVATATSTGSTVNLTLDGAIGSGTLVGGAGDDTYIWKWSYTGNSVIVESAGIDTINYEYNGMAGWSLTPDGKILIKNYDSNKNLLGSLSFNAGVIEKLNITGVLKATLNTTQLGIFDGGGANAGGISTPMFLLAKSSSTLNGGSSDDFITGHDVSGVQIRAGAGKDFINIANYQESVISDIYIDGGAGADVMMGASTTANQKIKFIVDDAKDSVLARAQGAKYSIESSVTYVLNNIEKESTGLANSTKYVTDLTLTGTKAINATGNLQDNLLVGNSGANILDGTTGNDTLVGGAGSDKFRFSAALNSMTNFDTVQDFVGGVDKIELSKAIFIKFTKPITAQNLSFHDDGIAQDFDDYLVYSIKDQTIYYDSDGSGAAAGVAFAKLTGVTSIIFSDFILY
jgi:serralysin